MAMDSKHVLRARVVLSIIILLAAGLVSTLYDTQISSGSGYVAKADRQYLPPRATSFDRGRILMSSLDGTHPAAAGLTSTYEISMNPSRLTDPTGAYDALAQYIDIDQEDFMRKAALSDDPYEEIARKADESTAQSISALALQGIVVTAENKRSYPSGLAPHIIGIVGEGASGNIEGKYGLERVYDQVLARSGGYGGSRSVFADIFTGISTDHADSYDQGDIITSIEPTVQAYLESVLEKTSDVWHPDNIGAIVMDPRTGAIIAAASLPSFDPNDLSDLDDPAVLSNLLVERVDEMGSILKPLTVAIGLDSGAVSPTWTYEDRGTMTLDGRKISNYDGKARGRVGLQEILSQSLNMGAATVALETGRSEFSRYFLSFGLGEKTGIDQPNEAAALVRNLESGRDIEIATASYGQGIAISPIVMTRALAVLANGGMLIKPHFAEEIDYVDGTVEKIDHGAPERVLKAESVEYVTRMLVKVVDEALRGGNLKIEGYSVAAKTGTAQIPDSANRDYYDDRYLHSFFGYFPAYDAKFLIFLYQKYPKGAQYASETLAEPFHELTKFLIRYYNIPPDR